MVPRSLKKVNKTAYKDICAKTVEGNFVTKGRVKTI